jgi:ABC-type transport system substrate-binding protein
VEQHRHRRQHGLEQLLPEPDDGLYTITMPGIELQPSLADGELQPATEDGDSWVGEITFARACLWSDGEAITAEDFAFTWQTAVDFELTANWQDFTDSGHRHLRRGRR